MFEFDKQKLSELIRRLRGERSQRDFADYLKVSQSTIQAWESGRGSFPSVENLEKLALATDFQPEQLLAFLYGRELKANVSALDDDDYVSIPILTISASAGGGCIPQLLPTDKFINFPRSFFNFDPKNVDAIPVSGDSMSPTINDGDLVMIDRSKTQLTDAIYVFCYEDQIFVKRLSHFGSKLQVLSDNPAYPSVEILYDSDFKLIGEVIYICQKT